MADNVQESTATSQTRREHTLQQVGFVPINPGPLMEVLRASPTEPESLIKAISRCPSLSARLLSVTNSAAFGVRRPLDSIRRAVLHLGAARARSVALAFGLRALHEGVSLDEPWKSQLWIASLQKAASAQLACELVDPARADSAYCLALIQDVALPLLVSLDPNHYQRVIVPASQESWRQLERERFGIDHIELGMRLLRSWDASLDMRQSLQRHHEPPASSVMEQNNTCPIASRRAIMQIPLYLASLVPHLDEELTARQRQWLTAIHAIFLAPTYPSPDAFYQAAAEHAAPLHAGTTAPPVPREQMTAAIAEALHADVMSMVTQLNRLETALGQQREDLDNLRFQAFTDPLTKLLNRRGFTHLAERRIEIAASHGLSLCLMVMDLDHFKPVNDQFGHEAGDRMLKAIATLLRQNLDRNDLVARVGGDEFVVLLCGVDEQKARDIAERVVDACLNQSIQIRDEPVEKAPVRFSLGAVHVPCVDNDLNLEDLTHTADEAMYQRKREGRGGLAFRRLET